MGTGSKWVRILFALAALPCWSVAGRAENGVVVIYTPVKASAVDYLTQQFTQETGIRTETVQANTGTLVHRIEAEKRHPHGDVLWGIGGADLEANKQLLEPFNPDNIDEAAPQFRVSKVWTPFSAVTALFIVNTDMLQPAQYPTTWKSLGDPAWKGKVASTRADQSGSAFQELATVLAAYGDDAQGWAAYDAILRSFTFVDSTGQVARVVNDGESPVGITLEDNALDYVNGGGPVALVYPKDGTSVVPDGMAVIRNAPDQAAAKRFIAWMLGAKAQAYVVNEIGRRSVRGDAGSAPKGAASIGEIKQIHYDFEVIGGRSPDWVAHWRQSVQKLH